MCVGVTSHIYTITAHEELQGVDWASSSLL